MGFDMNKKMQELREQNKKGEAVMSQLMAACESAAIPIYGKDFLCRTLAIIYCYASGPGGEYFRAPVGHAVSIKAWTMLEEAVMQKDWETVQLIRLHVKELQADQADWLPATLDRLNIPISEIKFANCLQPKPARGT